MNPADDFSNRIEEAIKHPKNLGELDGADAVGTVGSEDCGDMLRMWVKFKEVDGKRVIDQGDLPDLRMRNSDRGGQCGDGVDFRQNGRRSSHDEWRGSVGSAGFVATAKNSLCATCRGSAPVGFSSGCAGAQEKNVAPTLLQRMQSPAQEKRKIILGPSNE